MIDLSKSQLFSLDGTVIQSLSGGEGTATLVPPSIVTGTVIDQKYKILALLGEGGMGAVYRARHLLLNKDVALKTLRTAQMAGTAWQRFQREAQSIAKLNHTNIVQVFDFGIGEDNMPFYTMECLEGETLSEKLRRQGTLSIKEAAAIFLQVCRGLTEAHSKGIIHRDLKPGNIFLATPAKGRDQLVKIVDFGLANLASHSMDQQKLTSTGSVFGTPLYMSPEQSLGHDLKPTTDIYSCACSLYEALTGEPPYRKATAFATMFAHQTEAIPGINENRSGLHFPQRLEGLIKRMMVKDDAARIQSMAEVEAELEWVLATQTAEPHGKPHNKPLDIDPAGQSETIENKAGSKKAALPAVLALTVMTLVALTIVLINLPKNLPNSLAKNPSATKTMQPVEAVPENAQTVSAPPHVQPYLQNPGATFAVSRTFVFPDHAFLGQMVAHTISKKNGVLTEVSHQYNAEKTITVPPMSLIELMADQQVAEKPWLLGGFGPHDLNSLRLMRSYPFGEQHLPYVSKLTDLVALDFGDFELSGHAIDTLNALPNLHNLAIRHTNLVGDDFCRLNCLPRMNSFWVTGTQKLSSALERMRNSKTMLILEVDECDLTDYDLNTIGTLPNLQYLNLNDNKKVTDKGVAALSKLKELTFLALRNTKVTHACIDSLKKLPKLNQLAIDSDLWPISDRLQLQEALPQCTLVPRRKDDRQSLVDDIKKRPDTIEQF